MARVNTDILGISELKWTGMGEFNSDYNYIYYCGQELLRRNGVVLIVNKSLKYSTWVLSRKRQNDLGLFPRQSIQHHSNPSLCTHPLVLKKLKLNSSMNLQEFLELTENKTQNVLFIIGDWNAKVESQEILGVTGKFGIRVQNEAGQKLTELCQENTLVIANTLFLQHKRRLYTWTSPDGQY